MKRQNQYQVRELQIEGSIDKSKWQEVIKELPAYKTDGDEIYYYTYSITEAKVDGYTTTIDKSQDGLPSQ